MVNPHELLRLVVLSPVNCTSILYDACTSTGYIVFERWVKYRRFTINTIKCAFYLIRCHATGGQSIKLFAWPNQCIAIVSHTVSSLYMRRLSFSTELHDFSLRLTANTNEISAVWRGLLGTFCSWLCQYKWGNGLQTPPWNGSWLQIF